MDGKSFLFYSMGTNQIKGDNLMKTLLRSQEFSCPSCAAKIEKALIAVDGVKEAKVHFNTGRIEVEHDLEKVGGDKLVQAVRSVGYESEVSPF